MGKGYFDTFKNWNKRKTREVAGVLSKGKFYTVHLINGDPETVIVDLLNAATRSVDMCSSLAPIFYVKKPKVKQAFKKALTRDNVKTRLIFDPTLSNWADIKNAMQSAEETGETDNWVDNLIEKHCLVVRENKTVPHWMIVDGTHIRIEEQHNSVNDTHILTTNGIMHNAGTCDDEAIKILVSNIKNTFESWWNTSSEV
jgi:hypothetical protein